MKGQFSILLVFCAISGSLAKPTPTFLEYKDSWGQYSFGYSAPESARSEVRSLDGSLRGSYSYVDDAGVIQSAQYTADDEHGFQVVATNLPQAPSPIEETPEVVAARLDHFKALQAASKLAEENPEIENQVLEAIMNGKESGSVIIEDPSESVDDTPDNQMQTKSADDPEVAANRPAESQSEENEAITKVVAKIGVVESEGGSPQITEESDQDVPMVSSKTADPEVAANRPAESQSKEKEAITKVAAKIGVVGPEGESPQIVGKSGQDEPMSIQSLPGTRDSSRPNIPVVTTSFVIPGRVNLHSRIELNQSGVTAARFSLEPYAAWLETLQSSMLRGQGEDSDRQIYSRIAW